MHRILVQAAPILAAVLLSSACASAGVQAGPAGQDADCQGSAVLIVRNESGGEVQVVESRMGSGGQTVVTTLGPGRHEVRIRNQPGYAYAAQRVDGGATLAATSAPRAGDRSVTLERQCRPS